MKKILLFPLMVIFSLVVANAQLISEFQPNPPGSDPDSMQIELEGDPYTFFSGWISSIETDNGVNSGGAVDRLSKVSGHFNALGLLVVTIQDLENPSFVVILSSDDPTNGGTLTEIDSDRDGTIDYTALNNMGIVYDAIQVIDRAADSTTYASQLNGTNFPYTGAEPVLMFRRTSTDEWYALNPDETTIITEDGTTLDIGDFDPTPTAAGTFNATNTLPIELTFFTAQAGKDEVTLDWGTASEENNDYMAIERSLDGERFESIGKVAGAGTTTEAQTYTFVDANPAALNYYRLKQVDFDGAYEYSEIVAVKMEISKTFAIHPNPTRSELTVSLEAASVQNTPVLVFDLQGRQMAAFNIEAGATSLTFDLDGLANGTYIIRVGEATQRIIKK